MHRQDWRSLPPHDGDGDDDDDGDDDGDGDGLRDISGGWSVSAR